MSDDKQIISKQRLNHYHAADINDKLIINIQDLSHTTRLLFEGKGSQKRILIILSEAGKITQRDLTNKLGIKPGSASEVLAKLEGAGLIKRSVCSDDHRTVDITLTHKGRIAAQDAALQRKIRHEQMFTCLSGEEKQTFLTLMEKVVSDWNLRYSNTQRGESNVEVH